MLRRELPSGYALRLLEESDADELFALIDANREHLAPVDAVGAAATASPPTCCPSSALTRRQIADNDGLQTAIVDPDGRIVGVIGFHGIDWLNRKTSIGYWLARGEQGRGTMTAAVRALRRPRLRRPGSSTASRSRPRSSNARSRAIPERLGFREEGILREVERVGGRMLDDVVYAMLAADWPGSR